MLADDAHTIDLRPGLVLGTPEVRRSPEERLVRSDVAAFVRVERSLTAVDPDQALTLTLDSLPGSPDGERCRFVVRVRSLDGWDEEAFRGEFRTRQSALGRLYFDNGGQRLHLLDLCFEVPPFDPATLPADVDPEEVAEEREQEALLAFYDQALERLDDIAAGEVSQVVLPDLWLHHAWLLPTIWARVAAACRRTGNRMLVADGAPPFALLQDAERRRAAAEGVALTLDELQPDALLPWHRVERWRRRDDVPVEVALTLDAVEATREAHRRSPASLGAVAVYWPWLRNRRGLIVPLAGIVAGVYARSDRENRPVGVKKPPANEPIKGISDFGLHTDERPLALLRRAGVNCSVSRSGKGLLVWGARTLAEDDLWQFINVRRLVGWIGRQMELDNGWAVFENHDEKLRETVARDVEYFLHDLWEKGALQGDRPEAAYKVICAEENNPRGDVDGGILNVDVWVNPVQTNEFVHLKLTYGDASVE